MRQVYNVIGFKTNSRVEWFRLLFLLILSIHMHCVCFLFFVLFCPCSFFSFSFNGCLATNPPSPLPPPPIPSMIAQMLLNSFCVLSFQHCTLFVSLRCRWLFFFVTHSVYMCICVFSARCHIVLNCCVLSSLHLLHECQSSKKREKKKRNMTWLNHYVR